jgi:hypothetical protein
MKKALAQITMGLVAAWLMMGAPAAITAQLDGPGVCGYRDGTVLNFGGWPCGSPPWAPAPTTQPSQAPPGNGKG